MSNAKAKERNAAAVQRLFAKRQVPSPSPWVGPSTRLSDGTLPPEVQLGNQWQLAHEVGHEPALLGSNTAAAPCRRADEYGDPLQSCYSMNRKIAHHAWPTPADAKRKLQGHPGAHASAKERRAARERDEAIIRYELSIPRRRVAAHYSHLTAGQADLHKTVPTAHTMDRLVERTGGRWVLQNPHRQQLLRGEPVMTRIMHGEFYEGKRGGAKATNFRQANKRHVRVASDINHLLNATRAQ